MARRRTPVEPADVEADAPTVGSVSRHNSTEDRLRATRHLAVSRNVKPHHLKGLEALDSVTADAKRVTKANAVEIRRLTQPWQGRALSYYDIIPEIHFAAGFYARGLSGLRLYVGVMDAEGEITPSEDPAAIELLARVKDRAGGRETLLADYGRLAFVPGESFLLWTQGEGTDETWEVVSTDELRVDLGGTTYYRIKSPALSPEELLAAPDEDFEPLPGECIAYRMHTPHPRFSDWADSPMRACLDLCEELVLLTLVVRARVMSRLTGNGILTIPNELFPPADAEEGDAPGDEDAKVHPFMADLIEATVSPIEDPGTAAAQVPIILSGPGEFLSEEHVRHITLRSVEEEYRETGLRKECIERIAVGLDMPVEALLGMSGANHWNAWIIDEQTWKVHLKPIATAFCGNLTEAYLRPTAVAAGIANAENLVVMFDAASIVTNPDKSKDANEAYDRRAIGKKALREAKGFTDDDAPTIEDLAEMLEIEGVSLDDAGEQAQATTTEDDEGRDPAGEDTPREEPDEDESQVASAAPRIDPGLESRLLGAAELSVVRAREIAGARLLSQLRGAGIDVDKAIRDAPRSQVCHLSGPSVGNALTFVEDTSAVFVEQAIRWGLEPKAAGLLGSLIELHASRSLFEEEAPPLPSGFLASIRR